MDNQSPKDAKSETRLLLTRCVSVIATVFAAFQLIMVVFRPIDVTQLRSAHLAFAIVLALLTTNNKMLHKIANGKVEMLLKLVLMAGVVISYGYLFRTGTEISQHMGFVSQAEVIYGIIAVTVLLYASILAMGWVLPSIAVIFILYSLFGQHLPAPFGHRGYPVSRIVSLMYMSSEGMLGVATDTSARIVSVFIILAAFINASGAGDIILKLSMATLGSVRGGPAKIAVIASMVFGSISGSAVANVVSTGAFTIPLMKRVGYKPEFAGAVEAAASTGGQLVPPILGSAAFIMSEVIGVNYLTIAAAAIIPAILYYFSVFLMVDFEAIRTGLKGQPKSELPKLDKKIIRESVTLLPIVVLVFLMVGPGLSPGLSAFWSIVTSILVGALNQSTRLTPRKFFKVLESSGKMMIEIALVCGVAGIVIGILSLTGIGLKISSFMVFIANGSTMILLVLTALTAILLGCGLPSVAVYIVLAAVIAPTLVNMGIPILAAHLFVFFFGIIAVITPPVALASYAAAGIAGSSPNTTGKYAVILGSAGFIMPFAFVLSPVLLMQGHPLEILIAFCTASCGIFFLACCNSGYPSTNPLIRLSLLAAAVCMIVPEMVSDVIGLLVGCSALLVENKLLKPRRAIKKAEALD